MDRLNELDDKEIEKIGKNMNIESEDKMSIIT
jgi:hypothetical protein